LGVIDSLSAGYRFLTRRPDLILIPLVLDLLLWLVPRLSVAPLFEEVARFYRTLTTAPEVPADMVTLTAQVAEVLSEAGQSSNLWIVLALISRSLLHVPSLLIEINPLSPGTTQTISSFSTAFLVAALLSFVSITIGVVYLNLLARHLPIGTGPKTIVWRQFPGLVLRHSLLIVLYLVLVILALLALFVPLSLGMTLIALIFPVLTPVSALFFGALTTILFLYLYFVPVGLILDDLPLFAAIRQSFRLVRDNFWSTLGLILLTELIMLGFTIMLGRLIAFQPLGIVAAIVVNAFLGSGMAMGFMIFYRSRVLLAQGEPVNVEL